jgi:Protein of unknown function (DUF2867)
VKYPDWPVVAVRVPADSAVAHAYASTDLADAYSIRLPANSIVDPELLARFILSHQARWVERLIAVRDALVRRLGIKTAADLRRMSDGRIEFFKIYSRSAREIILGEDDSHLDFRLSVMRTTEASAEGGRVHLVLSTVVHCHNRIGRAYIRLIAPFHRMVVKSALRRAARAGWPTLHAG